MLFCECRNPIPRSQSKWYWANLHSRLQSAIRMGQSANKSPTATISNNTRSTARMESTNFAERIRAFFQPQRKLGSKASTLPAVATKPSHKRPLPSPNNQLPTKLDLHPSSSPVHVPQPLHQVQNNPNVGRKNGTRCNQHQRCEQKAKKKQLDHLELSWRSESNVLHKGKAEQKVQHYKCFKRIHNGDP